VERLVIPKSFENKSPADHLRVWTPGCATGEEAYSLAEDLFAAVDKPARIFQSRAAVTPRLAPQRYDVTEQLLLDAQSALEDARDTYRGLYEAHGESRDLVARSRRERRLRTTALRLVRTPS
jgi:hypothetical protein